MNASPLLKSVCVELSPGNSAVNYGFITVRHNYNLVHVCGKGIPTWRYLTAEQLIVVLKVLASGISLSDSLILSAHCGK